MLTGTAMSFGSPFVSEVRRRALDGGAAVVAVAAALPMKRAQTEPVRLQRTANTAPVPSEEVAGACECVKLLSVEQGHDSCVFRRVATTLETLRESTSRDADEWNTLPSIRRMVLADKRLKQDPAMHSFVGSSTVLKWDFVRATACDVWPPAPLLRCRDSATWRVGGTEEKGAARGSCAESMDMTWMVHLVSPSGWNHPIGWAQHESGAEYLAKTIATCISEISDVCRRTTGYFVQWRRVADSTALCAVPVNSETQEEVMKGCSRWPADAKRWAVAGCACIK